MDEVVQQKDNDFGETGLKIASLIRITRLAVVSSDLPAGMIGRVSDTRLRRLRRNLADWIAGA